MRFECVLSLALVRSPILERAGRLRAIGESICVACARDQNVTHALVLGAVARRDVRDAILRAG